MIFEIVYIGKSDDFGHQIIDKLNAIANYKCAFFDIGNIKHLEKRYSLYILNFENEYFDELSYLNNMNVKEIYILGMCSDNEKKRDLLMRLTSYDVSDVIFMPFHIEELLIKLKSFENCNTVIYKEFLDKMNVMAVITNDKRKITYCNNAFSSQTGYEIEEAIGQFPSILKSGKHSLMFYNNITHTLNAGLAWTGTFTDKKKNGSLYKEEASIFPMKINGEIFYGKTAINTTQHEEIANESKHALQLATAIQESLLPDDIYDENIIIRTKYLPLENVSGDIYNLYKINENVYCVFLADVVGHGIGSAFLTTAIIAVANGLIKDNYMPDFFLKELNNKIMGLFNSNELPQTTYFTAAYVVIDLENQKIHYANCGHPKVYLMDDQGVHSLMKKNFFIGMFQNVDYEYSTHNYKNKCSLLIYTDGLSEFSNDMKKDIKVLENKLIEFNDCNNKLDLIDYLNEEIIKHHNSKDDISIISVELTER